MTTAYVLINCDLGSEADIIKKIEKVRSTITMVVTDRPGHIK